MNKRLWVPPPPETQPATKRGRKGLGKGARARRKRSAGRTTALLASVVVTLLLLIVCVLAVAFPILSFPYEGSRINVLLLGIDRRSGSGWAYRTDTIVIVTMEPGTRAAGMLSIPRDLQVTIPGHGEDRINTANVLGSSLDNPEGGPDLLKDTVETNFGIPIDGYLMVDFSVFEEIVDTLDGIEVMVPRALHDTRYPDPRPGDPHAFKTIHFDPGWQHMDGKRALEYARSRMSTTDFDRAKRQQLILLAIRERALSLGAIPRWPLLAKTVADGVKTDMSPEDMLALAGLAARIDPSHLKQVVLEHPLVVGHRRTDGAAVQLPRWELINPVLEDLFGPRESR
jgi:LCP family protein required for cell wall assembly